MQVARCLLNCLQGISYVTVDNPHTVEALLQRVLPGITVKMDPGHVLFSRLGKLLDKNHALYGEQFGLQFADDCPH